MSATDLDRALHASVLKREAVKEHEYRERRRREEEEAQLRLGSTEMTKQELRKIIDSDRRSYYRTEELNDKLYIHYKGWRELQNLEGWTGLKALYAECNAFARIQGLENCRKLRSLFLQENCIHRIEGLENCPDLWNINLSNNFIERIEGISQLRSLNTLTIAKNRLGMGGVADLIQLVGTPIASLDIQDNQIWDPDVLPEVFMRMTELRVLYLKGNPCTKKIPNYRKNITVCCEDLRYLDDRPVFPEDRRAADAFNRGGLEEERAEKRRMREENNAKHEANIRAFNEMVARAREERRERDAMRLEDKFTDETDPVESQERRMKRQVDKWKEENAEDLKDDAKEHAERCLRKEREAAAGREQSEAADENKAARGAEAEDTDTTSKDTDITGKGAAEHSPKEATQDKDETKVDNRRLVYEDIWDDVPKRSQQKEIQAASATPAGNAGASTPEAAAPGMFLPWASGPGIVGMDSVARARTEKDKAAAASAAAEQQSGTEGGGERYARFSEKSQSKPGAPPPASTNKTPQADPVVVSELDEMD